MNKKLLSAILTVSLFIVILAITDTVVNAQNSNILCFPKQNIIITLKNNTNMENAEAVISKIPNIKIIKITNRNEEWSELINRMDLPNIENPFKNEFVIKLNRKADKNEIYKKIDELDFVENIKYDCSL